MVPHDPARNARGGPFDGSAYAVGRAEFTIKQLKTNTRTLKHKHALQSLMTECATQAWFANGLQMLLSKFLA